MIPGGPPKTKVTAWEAIEILMGRIDKELDRLENEKKQPSGKKTKS